MMKVIGAGLPRTGTTSTKAALERLGFGPCHHMFEIITRPEKAPLWADALGAEKRTKADWDRLFEGYHSAQDWPSSHYWRELIEFYPEAKVVLTVRDPHKWDPSIRALLSGGAGQETPEGEAPDPITSVRDRIRPVLDRIGREHFGPQWSFGAEMPDEETMVAGFERHTAAVIEGVPKERLLVFDVREGWGPLCDFLGVEAPEEPYPHLNDRESMRRIVEAVKTGGSMPSFSELGR